MPRASIPPGQWGDITTRQLEPGRWRARAKIMGHDGRKHDISRVGASRVKAETALKLELQRLSQGGLSGRTSVAEMAQTWLDGVMEDNLAIATKRTYEQMVRKHLVHGSLAEVPLEELTVAQVSGFLRKLAQTSGQGAAKTTRTCLLGTLDLAVHHRLVEGNVVRSTPALRAPRTPARTLETRDTRRALTVPEQAALLAYADADDYAQRFDLPDLMHFLAGTGCRIGEALALRWPCLDLERGTADVGPVMVRVPGEGLMIQEQGKTEFSDRTLYLSERLLERLDARPRRTEMVFPSPLGKLREVVNTNHSLRKVYDAAGFPWMTTHTFRRTVATRLHEAGLTDREIANHLGHSRVSMTQDIYLDRRAPTTRARDVL